MAVPKGKVSKARRNSRKANWKVSSPSIVKSKDSNEYTLPHRVSKTTGLYKGVKVVEVEKVKKENN